MKTAKVLASPKNYTLILIIVALAQFIITIDSTFMNVSISTLVKDLNTTVTAIQSVIALYTLVMAALMIPGAKLADIFGRKKVFIIGLAIYGVGTVVTSLSQNVLTFAFGWSILEGIGASLMLPAMIALIAANFPAGPHRTKAYAMFAAIASIAAAVGPIVGGFFTTFLSWRLAFFSELFVVLFIFWRQGIIIDAPLGEKIPRFDFGGFALSASGLATMVFGIILASIYGIFHARKDVVVAGHTLITTGQISPTIWLVAIGIVILLVFFKFENWRQTRGKDVLLNVNLLKIRVVSAGSFTLMIQYLSLIGAIYALSLYLQMSLNYNAIETGLSLVPLSLAVMVAAVVGSKLLSNTWSPKRIMQVGFAIIIVGVVVLGLTARDASSGWDFIWGLAIVGFGIGLVGTQNQNLMISSVPNSYSSETSGLINTFKNIGTSLGTAIAGAIIISILSFVFIDLVNQSPVFTSQQQQKIDQTVQAQAQVMSTPEFTKEVASLPEPQQSTLISINNQARNRALSTVYLFLGVIGILGLVSTFILPRTKPLNKIKANPTSLPS